YGSASRRCPMTRFVALGDSITVGMGDPVAPGSQTAVAGQIAGGQLWRGWAALLAESLGAGGEVEDHHFAELRPPSHPVAADQLAGAVELRPDVAAVIVGVNDTLRGSFTVTRMAQALERTVSSLRSAGVQVLTCSLPDPGLMLRLPKGLARPLARRI